jgi:DNA invertase Pin-like site-specific DNA recombinase
MSNREAIPVGRFSTPEQQEGDSERRQALSFRRVCDRWGLVPSKRWEIFDRGLSAYHEEHLSKGKLGKFLAQAEAGKVNPDSQGRMPALVFEAVDRLVRSAGLKANDLIRRFVALKIPLVFDEADLWIDETTIDDKWIMLQVLIDQAHKYSQRLARRLASSWEGKRNETKPTKHSCPRWLEWNEAAKHYEVIEEEAEVVRDMFRRCADGESLRDIMRVLPHGWSLSQVASYLGSNRGREVLGEWQPCKGNWRKPVGEPHPNEYPSILTEAEFYAAQNELASRRKARGPKGKGGFVHLFKGLVFDLEGEPLWIQGDGPKWCRRVLRPRKSYLNREGAKSVPYVWVEKCILHFVSELDPQELEAPERGTVSPVADLLGKLATNKAKLEKLQQRLLSAEADEVDDIQDSRKALREQRRELEKQLDAARAEAVADHPAALREVQSCYEALLKAEDDAATRTKLAGLIRQVIERVIIVPSEERGDFSGLILVGLAGGLRWYAIEMPDLREDPALEGVVYRVIDCPLPKGREEATAKKARA